MTMDELKGKYARVRDEIHSLGGAGGRSEAKLARLHCELDQIEQDLVTFRRLALSAPTLRDVVVLAEPVRQRPNGRSGLASAA